MVKLTVFTPTFNRADLLTRCYEGMKRQTNKDFIWLIVDDGSTDDTAVRVKKWMSEKNSFLIQYYYKENGGLHTAYNTAIAHLSTELAVCIDSDDFMPENAVFLILRFWETYGSDKYAGIVGLDYTLEGSVLGDYLPERKSVNLIDLLTGKYRIINGDRTLVVRTELYKKYAPMKVFSGEKNFNPHYMHLQISREYDFLVLNENLRFVEYQPTGMSSSILYQYRNSPNSFGETRLLYLSFPDTPIRFRIRHLIHLASSGFLAEDPKMIFRAPVHPVLASALLPLGWLLSKYIICKTKKGYR